MDEVAKFIIIILLASGGLGAVVLVWAFAISVWKDVLNRW